MLLKAEIVKTPSSVRLIKAYQDQYIPELPPEFSTYPRADQLRFLGKSAIDKINNSLLGVKCQLAGMGANSVYQYIDNVVDLKEARTISEAALPIYRRLLSLYQQSFDALEESSIDFIGSLTPDIDFIATDLEAELLEFQRRHEESKSWRTLGFLTTLINFNNVLLLKEVSLYERALLEPYLRFVEEHVTIPWQRVCAVSSSHTADSPAFRLVEQLIPDAQDIAETVYRKLAQSLPHHQSKRGNLQDQRITHSCIRDLKMFQSYLWLCLLDEKMDAIEDELVDLCARVMPTVGVSWDMVSLWSEILSEELLNRVSPAQQAILLPYTEGLKQAFHDKHHLFTLEINDNRQKINQDTAINSATNVAARLSKIGSVDRRFPESGDVLQAHADKGRLARREALSSPAHVNPETTTDLVQRVSQLEKEVAMMKDLLKQSFCHLSDAL